MSPEAYSKESSPQPSGAGERIEDSGTDNEASATDALQMAWARFVELGGYARYFVSAKIDRLKLTIRQYVVLAILAMLGLLAAAGAVVTAIVLALRGVAGGLAVLCGNTPWLGDLLCGVLVLGGVAILLRVALVRVTRMSREATINKYESDERNNLDPKPSPDARSSGGADL